MSIRWILLATGLGLLSSCSTIPEARYCDQSWEVYDTIGKRDQPTGLVVDNIHPDANTFRDRQCAEISKQKFEQAMNFIAFLDKHHEYLRSWTEEERERRRYPEDAKLIDSQMSYEQKNPATQVNLRDAKEMLADVENREKVFNDLRAKLKTLTKETKYLIPVNINAAKEWVSLDNPKKTANEKQKILAAIKSKVDNEGSKEVNHQKYLRELSVFLATAHSKYGLTANEIKLLVVRSDMVDDWGMNLGTTIFKIMNSKTLKVVDYKINQGSQKVFTLLTEGRHKDVKAEFNFVIKEKYAILQSIETGTEKATGPQAMTVLNLASQ